MSTQHNNSELREKLGIRFGFLPRRKGLAGIVALLMGASLIFSGSASAHNIELAKAREVAREFARTIRAQSNGSYRHYTTNCVIAYPGHNHIVRCMIGYQNAKDTAKGLFTCRETLEVYFRSHSGGEDYTERIRHTSRNKCGPIQGHVNYVN